MNSNNRTAKIIGALFLTVMVAYIIGAALLEPILTDQNVLNKVAENKTLVITGVLFELINGIAYIGIAVLIYPLLKNTSESLALSYVCFRVVEFVMQIISDLSPLLLTSISQDFVTASTSDALSIKVLSEFLLAQRFWANQMVFITYSLGAVVFYYLLFQSKLIPRWLSIWGLIGAPLVLISVILVMLGYKPPIILGAQMGLNEIVLGLWLIIKGFNKPEIKPALNNG